jgi:hypothetical protein
VDERYGVGVHVEDGAELVGQCVVAHGTWKRSVEVRYLRVLFFILFITTWILFHCHLRWVCCACFYCSPSHTVVPLPVRSFASLTFVRSHLLAFCRHHTGHAFYRYSPVSSLFSFLTFVNYILPCLPHFCSSLLFVHGTGTLYTDIY